MPGPVTGRRAGVRRGVWFRPGETPVAEMLHTGVPGDVGGYEARRLKPENGFLLQMDTLDPRKMPHTVDRGGYRHVLPPPRGAGEEAGGRAGGGIHASLRDGDRGGGCSSPKGDTPTVQCTGFFIVTVAPAPRPHLQATAIPRLKSPEP